MTLAVQRRRVAVRFRPGRAGIAAAVVAAVAGWLLALGGLVTVVALLPELGWARTAALLTVFGSPVWAIWSTRHAIAAWQICAAVPAFLLARQCHGNLDEITDTERRPLRSIGATAAEVAAQTGALLTELVASPNVRIFCGIRTYQRRVAPTPHAVAVGRTVVLVESVAWPPGRYRVDAAGRLRCDGVYIGQSAAALLAAVRYWQKALPRGHRVRALVVVHLTADGEHVLPDGPSPDIHWVLAEHALPHLYRQFPRRPSVSRHAVAALAAATPANHFDRI